MISGRTRIFGLVGHPVRHSLSPVMHSALFSRLGIDAVYVAFDVNPDRADRVADALRTLDVVGVNLTVPFKERILPHLDHLTLAVQEAGAANVVINVEGHLTGYNTDGEGFLAAVAEEHDFEPARQACCILGAGGAARAVAAALAVRGASRVTLFNRSPDRAKLACQQLAERTGRSVFLPEILENDAFARASADAALVANCLGGDSVAVVEALPIAQLGPGTVWIDTNYWRERPPKLAACAARGLRSSTGLGMLMHQGALSFELFTGHPIDVDELREILSEAR